MAWTLRDTYQVDSSFTIRLYQTDDREYLEMLVDYHLGKFEIACRGTYIRFTVDNKQYFAYSVSANPSILALKIYVENA